METLLRVFSKVISEKKKDTICAVMCKLGGSEGGQSSLLKQAIRGMQPW